MALAFSAAATMASASSTVLASGFSQSTCLPASSAAMAISAWVWPGRADVDEVDVVALEQRLPRGLGGFPAEPGGGRGDLARVPAASAAIRTWSGRSKKRGAVRQACEWAAPMKA